jgi:DNA-binding GntR family transcriptional regulator
VELSSLHDDLERAQRKPRSEVLSFAVVPATDAVATALALPPDCSVVAIERLRYAEDEPLALMRNYLPGHAAEVSAELLADRGLYQILRNNGVRMRVADQTIGARKADAKEARLLNETRGAPLLTMSRTAYDDAGRAVEYGNHVYRASRYSFELTLVAG